MAMTMTTAAIHSRPTLTPTAIPIMAVLSASLPITNAIEALALFLYYRHIAA